MLVWSYQIGPGRKNSCNSRHRHSHRICPTPAVEIGTFLSEKENRSHRIVFASSFQGFRRGFQRRIGYRISSIGFDGFRSLYRDQRNRSQISWGFKKREWTIYQKIRFKIWITIWKKNYNDNNWMCKWVDSVKK